MSIIITSYTRRYCWAVLTIRLLLEPAEYPPFMDDIWGIMPGRKKHMGFSCALAEYQGCYVRACDQCLISGHTLSLAWRQSEGGHFAAGVCGVPASTCAYREAPKSSWGRPRRTCCGANIKACFVSLCLAIFSGVLIPIGPPDG